MDISTIAVQSYQHHEQPHAAVQKNEKAHNVHEAEKDALQEADLSVSISDQRAVFDWIAQTFDHPLDTTSALRTVTQSLFDYGIIGVDEQKAVNQLFAQNAPEPILQVIEGTLPNTDSFSEKATLNNLYRVFSTLEAARAYQ